MSAKDIQLSKSLSWLLRHGAVQEGIYISKEGYDDVNKIISHRLFKGKYNIADIERVVNYNDKQRFKLRTDPRTSVLQIKANQGHTITQVSDAGLIPITEPIYKTVIHGTYLKCWPLMKENGLSRMKRQHIHASKGDQNDKTVISGLRANAQVHIYIDLAMALSEGVKFYESENGVILTAGEDGVLAPKYFSKVIKVSTGELLYP